ncbi:MAG: hypothetical protein FJ379_02560 [Verrucomicrobia bacterium]|nr:hypothetical protein [Verrucomicrobiota bacterium]
MDLWWYPLLFLTGLVAGCVDAIAGGGGLLTVPVLLATGLPPQEALGTNKFQSSCGTTLATWNYARHGLFDGQRLRVGIVATLVGALLGTWTVTRIRPEFLRPLIPIVLIAIAGYTAWKPSLGSASRPALLPETVFGATFGLVLGFYDGVFGPGTGSFWTVACVVVLGSDLLQATAYTKAMNLASNLASLVLFALTGHVHYGIGLTMASGQFLGGWLGARWAVRSGSARIRPVFLTMVMLLALKLAFDALRS